MSCSSSEDGELSDSAAPWPNSSQQPSESIFQYLQVKRTTRYGIYPRAVLVRQATAV